MPFKLSSIASWRCRNFTMPDRASTLVLFVVMSSPFFYRRGDNSLLQQPAWNGMGRLSSFISHDPRAIGVSPIESNLSPTFKSFLATAQTSDEGICNGCKSAVP